MPQTEAPQNKPTLYCSFCGKNQFEVAHLIAGPFSFICNECVDLCVEILIEMGDTKTKAKNLKRRIRQLEVREREAKSILEELASVRAELAQVETAAEATSTS